MADDFSRFIRTLERPFYAVIFQTPQTAGRPHWGLMSDSMIEFAAKQPGFLGVATERAGEDFNITMTFWKGEDAIKAWEALIADKPIGYKILISKVEDSYVKTPVT